MDDEQLTKEHREQIKRAVQYLQQYIDTYDQQPGYTDYTYKTLVFDIVYGLGVAVGGEKFSGYYGFQRWKHILQNILDGGDEFEVTPDETYHLVTNSYDPTFGDDRMCVCGHRYHRHFDSWEDMAPVGCKYSHDCGCTGFEEHQ